MSRILGGLQVFTPAREQHHEVEQQRIWDEMWLARYIWRLERLLTEGSCYRSYLTAGPGALRLLLRYDSRRRIATTSSAFLMLGPAWEKYTQRHGRRTGTFDVLSTTVILRAMCRKFNVVHHGRCPVLGLVAVRPFIVPNEYLHKARTTGPHVAAQVHHQA